MMHFVCRLGISKRLQTLINKLLLRICLLRIIIIPILLRRARFSPSFCNESVTELGMKPGWSAHTVALLCWENLHPLKRVDFCKI